MHEIHLLATQTGIKSVCHFCKSKSEQFPSVTITGVINNTNYHYLIVTAVNNVTLGAVVYILIRHINI